MSRTALAERIEREIERQAGLSVVVEEDGGTIVLTGVVDSPRARQAAEDVAIAVAPAARVDNGLDVSAVAPLSTDSRGTAIRVSTSSGASPGASVMMVTRGRFKSGKTSIGRCESW